MARRKQNRRERRRRASRGCTQAAPGAALQALWGSALALGGMPHAARADAPVERFSADYNYSMYSEDKIPSEKVFFGSTDRYEIDMHQLSLRSPLTATSDLALQL